MREFHSLLASTHLSLGLLPCRMLLASFPGNAHSTGARSNSKPFTGEPRLKDAACNIKGARLHYSAADELATPQSNVDNALVRGFKMAHGGRGMVARKRQRERPKKNPPLRTGLWLSRLGVAAFYGGRQVLHTKRPCQGRHLPSNIQAQGGDVGAGSCLPSLRVANQTGSRDVKRSFHKSETRESIGDRRQVGSLPFIGSSINSRKRRIHDDCKSIVM